MPRTRKKSKSRSPKRKSSNKQVVTKWAIRVLGFATIVIAMAVVYGFLRLFTYAASPIREFQHFDNAERVAVDVDHQIYVGIWYEEQIGSPKSNAIAVINIEDAVLSIHELPKDFSAKDPQSLSKRVGLPVDRYIIVPIEVSEGMSMDAFLTTITDDWYGKYAGIRGYLNVPSLLHTMSQYIYTDISPQEFAWFARFSHSIQKDDVTVRAWPTSSVEHENDRMAYFVDPAIVKGDSRIWIRNATELPGLATTVSELATNMGYEVIRVDTYVCDATVAGDCDASHTRILVSEEHENTFGPVRLQNVLGGEIAVSAAEELKRVDIVLLVGEDVSHLAEENE